MNHFKKQMNGIKIPNNLHERSLQSMHQAQKEQKKPTNWLPKGVASIITFAAIGFIALHVGEREIRQQTASNMLGTSEIAPPFYWLFATSLMILCMVVMRYAIGKGMHRKLGILSCVIIFLMLGNSAFFLHNQLAKPITVPLVHDLFAGNATHDLLIRYIVNKNDHRAVSYLQAGELTLMARSYNQPQTGEPFYTPADTLQEGNHQYLRAAYFVGSTEEMQALIESDEVFLFLDDGEKLETKLQIEFDSQYGTILTTANMTRGNSDGEEQGRFVLEQDAVFDEVYSQELLKGVVSFKKMKVEEETYTELDFPVAVEKGQQVTLFFKVNKAPMDLQTNVGVRGPNGILPIWIHHKADMDVKKIREELARHDGL